jgi:uncharacterized protein (DUF1684 family)
MNDRDAVLAWREQMERSLRADDGWLTVVGLAWLREGVNSVGSAPHHDVTLPAGAPADLGTITLSSGVARLDAAADAGVLVDGAPLTTATLAHDTQTKTPTQVTVGSITFFIIQRGDQYAVRIRDANSLARQSFAGRVWYDYNPAYRVTGQFTPHMSRHTLAVETVIGTTTTYNNPGTVRFELDGQVLALEAFEGGASSLWFVLRDATSGRTTYSASRFLYAPLRADGTVDLDFNRAYNPPCAFTPYATCPLPPHQNVLPIAIEAGEKFPFLKT